MRCSEWFMELEDTADKYGVNQNTFSREQLYQLIHQFSIRSDSSANLGLFEDMLETFVKGGFLYLVKNELEFELEFAKLVRDTHRGFYIAEEGEFHDELFCLEEDGQQLGLPDYVIHEALNIVCDLQESVKEKYSNGQFHS